MYLFMTERRALRHQQNAPSRVQQRSHPAMAPFRTKRLVIHFPSGKRIIVMWNTSDTVTFIKSVIEGKMGVPAKNQVLRWSGAATPLLNDRTLTRYNIRDETYINVEVLLEGGMNDHLNYDDLHDDEFGFRNWVQAIGGQNIAVIIRTPRTSSRRASSNGRVSRPTTNASSTATSSTTASSSAITN